MKPEDIIRIKDLLPTSLGSEEIREQIAGDILRRSVFSARMAYVPYLAKVREVSARLSAGDINQATARDILEGVLEQMGHSMSDPGGLTNPASIRRLNLIVETQTQMAASVAQIEAQNPAVVDEWPAWELMRLEDRAVPRPDWQARWKHAGDSVAWEGALQDRFIALKSSPIWQALGNGAGGYRDTLGNPYPPFAYSSGMGWEDVDRDACERLGLIEAGEEVAQPSGSTLAPDVDELRDAVKRTGFDELFKDFDL